MSPPLLAGLQLFLCGFVGPFDAYFHFGPAQKFRTSCPEFLKSPHEILAKLARIFSSNFIPTWDEVLIREIQFKLKLYSLESGPNLGMIIVRRT